MEKLNRVLVLEIPLFPLVQLRFVHHKDGLFDTLIFSAKKETCTTYSASLIRASRSSFLMTTSP